MKAIRLLLVSVLMCVSMMLRAQLPYFTHYNTVQGLAGNHCYDLLQDKWGFIWVATSAGISRFDGSYFQNYTVDNGLPDNEILKIYEDSSGKIWFMGLNGSIGYIENSKIYSKYNNAALAKITSKSVGSSFFEDKQHRIWMSFNDGKVAAIKENKVYQCLVPEMSNVVFTQGENQTIYAQNTNYSFMWAGNSFRKINLPNPHQKVKALVANNSEYVTTLHQDGNVFLSNYHSFTFAFNLSPYHKGSEVKMFSTPSNLDFAGVWLARNNGIRFIARNVMTPWFLSNVKVNKVIRAADQNYWFASNDGVFLLPNQDERYFIFNKDENQLWSNHVNCVYIDDKERIWLGYEGRVVDVFEQGKLLKRFHLEESNASNELKQFSYDAEADRLYLISDFDINYFDQISTSFPYMRGLNHAPIGKFAIKQIATSSKYLALATSAGVYLIHKQRMQRFKIPFDAIEFSHSGRAFDVFFDKNEHLWFSDVDGLCQYSHGELMEHYAENTLLTRRINDIKSYQDSVKILATDGSGVLFYNRGKVIHQLTQINGLSSNICQKIFVKNDTIWIQTARGCNYIVHKNNRYYTRSLNFIHAEISDKLTDLFIGKHIKSGYLASDKGLIVFSEPEKNNIKPTPKVYIRNVRINDENIDFQKSIIYKSFKTYLMVQFASISYNNTSISYRYKLNDENWVETNSSKIEFASLLPGTYDLMICANKNNGEWSQPVLLHFILKPPFWWRWWFITLVIIFLISLMYLFVRVIIHRQRERERIQLRTQNKILALEQQALQAMMNPHFVFNVMNAIQHFINTKDNAGANKMLTGFARLIRKNLDICNKSKISVQEEIQYLELYLSLEKLRFGKKLDYHIEVQAGIDTEEIMIPTMILQPFVENSVWHGILPKEEGGAIQIQIKMPTDKKLQIDIKDNGVGIDNSIKSKKSAHISKGMRITQERIALIAQIDKRDIQLTIKQTGDFGTLVQLVFPV